MTIDEAIKHCEEVAEKYCEKVEDGLTADDFCDSCASEHRQLAEWLEELKAYREAEKEIDQYMEFWKDKDIGKCRGLFLASATIYYHKVVKEIKAYKTNDGIITIMNDREGNADDK